MKTLLPFVLSAIIPGLGQFYQRDFLKGALMLAIPFSAGIYFGPTPFIWIFYLSVIWSVADIYIKTEVNEGREKALRKLFFSIIVVIVIIPAVFYLFVISMKSGGDVVADKYFNEDRTREEILEIEDYLENYYSHYKKYPTDFNAFINSKPIWNHLKMDAWNTRYKYIRNDSTSYTLISAGLDRTFDTKDDITTKSQSH